MLFCRLKSMEPVPVSHSYATLSRRIRYFKKLYRAHLLPGTSGPGEWLPISRLCAGGIPVPGLPLKRYRSVGDDFRLDYANQGTARFGLKTRWRKRGFYRPICRTVIDADGEAPGLQVDDRSSDEAGVVLRPPVLLAVAPVTPGREVNDMAGIRCRRSQERRRTLTRRPR